MVNEIYDSILFCGSKSIILENQFFGEYLTNYFSFLCNICV